MTCGNCGYWWADVNADGVPISPERCHFDGPDSWAPCAYDSLIEDEDENYLDYIDETYDSWVMEMENEQAQTQRELDELWESGEW